MKLELKHLAPYLPYGLKIQGMTYGEIAELSCCTETSVNITDRAFQYGMWADIFDIKPILRPLSDLDSGNFEGLFYSEWLIEKYHTIGIENQINRIEDDIRWLNHCDYILIQHLFEWHFDVFGLIEKGLAIDINTIT
jgi:hypothetical protein